MTQSTQFTTEVAAGESVLQALQRETPLSEAALLDAARKGAVWVNLQRGRGRTRPRRQRDVHTDIAEGSTVILNYNPAVLSQVPLSMFLVSDHVNYGIWYKPAGMLCQGSKWSDHTTATQVAAGISGRRCHLVHRLDRAACGLLLIAYTGSALRALTSLFEKRTIHKFYQASIDGTLTQGLPLTIDSPIDGKSALTVVHTAEQRVQHNSEHNAQHKAQHNSEHNAQHEGNSDYSVLSLSIETGRKHQIRKHLSQMGHPIVGDRLYALNQRPQPGTAHVLSDSGESTSETVASGQSVSENFASDSSANEKDTGDRFASEKVAYENLQLVACGLRFLCPFTKAPVSVSINADAALAGTLAV